MEDTITDSKKIISLLQDISNKMSQKKDDLISAEDIEKDYNIPIQTVRKIFRDYPNLPIQHNLRPQRILRSAFEEQYLNIKHE